MLPSLEVDNVYIYIADAVRADFSPGRVTNRGCSVPTISSGIHSPTSISSIVSGTYLPQHQVQDFADTLPADVPNLLDVENIEAGFANTMNDVRFDPGGSEDIIANTLDIDSGPPELLERIESPFVFVERGPGGHAPYVEKHELDTGKNYFEDRGSASRSLFASEYTEAVEEDADWFLDRLELLDARGLLDDTLVIYTSDHGEMLGESGMQSHSPPIHPRHVYVPTVFIHPELSVMSAPGGVARHVDIAPTAASLLDIDWETPIKPVGRDLSSRTLAETGASFYANERSTPVGNMNIGFDSVWDRTGGYVFPKSGIVSRFLLAGYHLSRAPWRSYAREHALEHVAFKIRGQRTHWSPALSEEAARKSLDQIEQRESGTVDEAANEVPVDRLKELGYME